MKKGAVQLEGGKDEGRRERSEEKGEPGSWKHRLYFVVTIAASFFMTSTLGFVYTFGNINPYLTSYLRSETDGSVDYTDTLWISQTTGIAMCIVMPFIGVLVDRIPFKLYMLLGVLCNAGAILATNWAVQKSFWATWLTYGVLYGVSPAFIYPSCIKICVEWLPGKKGLISGVILMGYGTGSFVWTALTTWHINSDNLQPDLKTDQDVYYTQKAVLDRVPSCFLLLGIVFASIQLVCLALIRRRPLPSTVITIALTNINEAETSDSLETTTLQNKQDSKTYGANVSINGSDSRHAEQPKYHGVTARNTDKRPEYHGVTARNTDKRPEYHGVTARNTDKRPEYHGVTARNTDTRPEYHGVTASNTDTRPEYNGVTASNTDKRPAYNGVTASNTDTRPEYHGVTASNTDTRPEYNGVTARNTDTRPEYNGVTARNTDTRPEYNGVTARNTDTRPEYTWRQVLKSRVFWTIWSIMFLMQIAVGFILPLYKAYGQTFIPDDHFLAQVAMASSVCNAIGRPFWGLLADKFGPRSICLVTQSLLAILVVTFTTCQETGQVAFLLWVCAMFFTLCGLITLIPVLTLTVFGSKNFNVNMGLVDTHAIIGCLIPALIASPVKDAFGWGGMYLVSFVALFIGILLNMSLDWFKCGDNIPRHMLSDLSIDR